MFTAREFMHPVLFLLILQSIAGRALAESQTFICPTLSSSPPIDGSLADAVWKEAVVIADFKDKSSQEPAPAKTFIRLGWHSGKLFLGAELWFSKGHVIKSFSEQDDTPDMWEDDCVEMFVARAFKDPNYIQIMLNSDGRIYDSNSSHIEDPVKWNLKPRPEIKSRLNNGRLVIEAAFSLDAFASKPPGEGDVWGIKFCRTHWDRLNKGPQKRHVYTTHIGGTGNYSSRPFSRLVFGRFTAQTEKLFVQLDRKVEMAHPIHRLFEAQKTRVWAKPYRKLFAAGKFQSERLIFRDTYTGAEIWRLTHDPFKDGVTYANRYPWSTDGAWLMFQSRERFGGYWHMLLSPDGEHVMRLPHGSGLVAPRWRVGHPDELLSTLGRKLISQNIVTGERKTLVVIPDHLKGRAGFGPHGRWAVICRQGFGNGGELTVLDLEKGTTRKIELKTSSKDFAGDWLYSGGVGYVKGVPHVGYSLNHLPHLSREHQYQQWLMNLQTGEYRKVKYLSHGGTSPNRDRKVGYAGGGIYSTDFFGDDKKFVASAGSGGHIAWMSSPDWCLAGNAGKSGDSPFSCQLVQVFVNDGNWCRIAFGQTKNTTYGSYLFVNTSPDGTKAEYSSTMLGPRDMYWAVMNRPEPPRLLKATRANGKVLLEWERPETGKEYAGARIWRAEKSGGPYQLISGRKPVNGTTWSDPNPPASACYVATSVEPSTLESRRFSDEVRNTAANNEWPDKLRIYAEAETGKPAGSFAVNFHGTASNDRFIEHRRGDGEGILDLAVQCERATDYRLWIRARTTKGPASATANAGQQNLKIQLKPQAWSWHSFDGRLSLKAGSRSLRIQSIDPGFAVDKILLTDDFNMIPAGLGDTEAALPSRVKTLNAVPESPHEVRLSWQPDPSSDVHHFNIYRIREKGARPSQENLIGSPSSPAHLDWGLEPGSSFEYAVTAVDSFGRESEPVRASATTRALVRPPIIQVEAESGTVVGGEKKVVKDKDASGGAYLETPPDALKSEYRLSVSFTVEKEGNYIVWAALFPLKDTHIYLKFAVDGKPNALMYLGNSRQGSTRNRLLWRPLGTVSGETPVTWRLKPGVHRIEISHVGSPGFAGRYHAIDQFIVTNDRSWTPPGPTWDWE